MEIAVLLFVIIVLIAWLIIFVVILVGVDVFVKAHVRVSVGLHGGNLRTLLHTEGNGSLGGGLGETRF